MLERELVQKLCVDEVVSKQSSLVGKGLDWKSGDLVSDYYSASSHLGPWKDKGLPFPRPLFPCLDEIQGLDECFLT